MLFSNWQVSEPVSLDETVQALQVIFLETVGLTRRFLLLTVHHRSCCTFGHVGCFHVVRDAHVSGA